MTAPLIRDLILAEFDCDPEQTVNALSFKLKVRPSTIYRCIKTLCWMGEVYLASRQKHGQTVIDIYRLGRGEFEPEDPYKLLPVPYAFLPVWHNHIFTHAGQAPAERI